MLTTDLVDPLLISVTQSGKLTIYLDENDNSALSQHQLRLFTKAQRYPEETETQTFDFVVTINPCVSVAEDIETVLPERLVYTLGTPYMEVAKVNVTENLTCLNSKLTMSPLASELSIAFTVSNDTVTREVVIGIKSSSETDLPYGLYPI